MKRVVAYGPACVGNVAAGFDVLGAAMAPLDGGLWGDRVEVREAAAFSLTCAGPFAHLLPRDPEDNLAWKACEAFARRLGRALPPFALRLEKGLPVASGLGSSSATVVATLRALDAFLGHPLAPPKDAAPLAAAGEAEANAAALPAAVREAETYDTALLAAAGEAEAHASGSAHLDNVAPALLGGLRLVAADGRAHTLPFPPELRFVVVSPELTLSTRAARAALPRQVPLQLAVAHAQNLATLLHALHAADLGLLRGCLRDLLAEPHRAGLVPGFRAVQAAAMEHGAFGCSLSGSGPAAFAVAEHGLAGEIGEAMRRAWAAAGIAARVIHCTLDHQGARVLEAEGGAATGEVPAS